jgi:hypothetical protein
MFILDLARDTLRKWFGNNPRAKFPFNNRGEAGAGGEGGGEGGGQGGQGGQGDGGGGGGGGGTGAFYEGFAPEIKDHPSVKRYKSVEELAKGHIELEKRIGLKGVLIPSDTSSDEVKNEFYKAIGRPDTADGYPDPVLDNLHEGVKSISATDMKAFKEKAFELGISAKAAQGILDWHLGLSSQRLTDWDTEQKTSRDKAITALRSKWGNSYEQKSALANGLLKKCGSEELFNSLRDNPNPAMMEFLANVGGLLSEDVLLSLGHSNLGMTPDEAKTEINKITQKIMDTDANDPTYKDLLARKNTLYKIAYPGQSPA